MGPGCPAGRGGPAAVARARPGHFTQGGARTPGPVVVAHRGSHSDLVRRATKLSVNPSSAESHDATLGTPWRRSVRPCVGLLPELFPFIKCRVRPSWRDGEG